MARLFILLLLFCSAIAVQAIEKQPGGIVDAYDVKLKKLIASFDKHAAKLKKDAISKLHILRKQLTRKGDSDGANAVQDLLNRLKKRTVTTVTGEDQAEGVDDDLGGVPAPPGENSPAPLSKEQLEAGKNRKSRKITKPKALHKALAALNPAYNRSRADFLVKNGVIKRVKLNRAGIVNISPLAGLKHVAVINLDSNPIWNLKPLSKLHLRGLSLSHTDVSDLSPLRKLKLTWLNITGTKVSDLSPLRRMPLVTLHMNRCIFIKDISTLKRLKNLESLLLPSHIVKSGDLKFLKKLKKLHYIDTEWHEDQQPAEEFFRKLGK